jgi:hypothetical protein
MPDQLPAILSALVGGHRPLVGPAGGGWGRETLCACRLRALAPLVWRAGYQEPVQAWIQGGYRCLFGSSSRYLAALSVFWVSLWSAAEWFRQLENSVPNRQFTLWGHRLQEKPRCFGTYAIHHG